MAATASYPKRPSLLPSCVIVPAQRPPFMPPKGNRINPLNAHAGDKQPVAYRTPVALCSPTQGTSLRPGSADP